MCKVYGIHWKPLGVWHMFRSRAPIVFTLLAGTYRAHPVLEGGGVFTRRGISKGGGGNFTLVESPEGNCCEPGVRVSEGHPEGYCLRDIEGTLKGNSEGIFLVRGNLRGNLLGDV